MFADQTERKILFSLLCLLGITALTGCAPQSKHFGIIFSNSISGPGDIYRIPDNTQNKVEQLTFTPTIGEYSLFVSKNGDRLVFETDFYAGSEMEPADLAIEELRHIYLLDTTSKKLADITKVLEAEYPQVGPEFYMDWSPDQKQFVVIKVVVKNEGAESELKSFLEFVDFDGKNRKDVPIPTTGKIPSLINGVKWSPDGRKFILTQGVIGIQQQHQNPGEAILIYDLKSGKTIQLTDYQDVCFPQKWSPTSQQIVTTCSYVPPYSEGISGPSTIRILDVENPGQAYERLGLSPCYDPAWSPDGKQIVFVCDKETAQAGLFIINSDGNGIHEVHLGNPGSPVHPGKPVWSPDGTQIIYVAGSDVRHTNIYSVYTDGSNNHPLTQQEARYNIAAVYPLP